MSDDITIAPAFRMINRLEALLWISIGLVLFLHGWRRGSRNPLSTTLLIVMLFAFGISDLVEANTGAWWRPWWLLLWKGMCVLAILAALIGQRGLPLPRNRGSGRG